MASSLQEYLKRYTEPAKSEKMKKKKKKKSKPVFAEAVTIVDDDPLWQKEVKEKSSSDEDEHDEAPLVIKDVEVKRMQKLEAIKLHRPYISTAEDGSGWVELQDLLKQSPMQKEPSCTLRRHDTPDSSPAMNDLSPARRRHSPLQASPDRFLMRKDRLEYPDFSSAKARDESSPRKLRHDSPDLSPPRKLRHDSPDLSPPRKRQDEIPDLFPPRKRHAFEMDNLSNSRRRHDTPDLSPPRKTRRYGRMPSPAPDNLSNSRRHDTPGLSPPRKTRQHGREPSPAPDLSPRRRRLSPQGKIVLRKGHDEAPALSPKRTRVHADADLSPPRRSHRESSERHIVKKQEKTEHGTGAGLRHRGKLVEELEQKKQEAIRRLSEMDASISGRNANTVYRDKFGKRVELDELVNLQQAEKPPSEKPLEWGKGLAQKREVEARLAEIEAESEKPFARTRDDPDLDKHLREQLRWGDPMAHLVKKKITNPVLEDLGASEAMKESGFIVPQEIPKHSWLKRGLVPPPNRYDIKPGRHWDGVDRSNGFERDMYKRQNEKKADQVEAYLWSVADM